MVHGRKRVAVEHRTLMLATLVIANNSVSFVQLFRLSDEINHADSSASNCRFTSRSCLYVPLRPNPQRGSPRFANCRWLWLCSVVREGQYAIARRSGSRVQSRTLGAVRKALQWHGVVRPPGTLRLGPAVLAPNFAKGPSDGLEGNG